VHITFGTSLYDPIANTVDPLEKEEKEEDDFLN
jgi:hypothetical protein